MKKIFIINARGEREPFSLRKVFNSARRAGASKETAQNIASIIQKEVYQGMRTSEIFKKVRTLLLRKDLTSALRFNLKEGIRKLGPSGFPFEKYIGDIFSEIGFDVLLNQRILGRCVRHEVDFVARKERTIFIGECKYKVSPGERIDLRIGLANHAKFLDLKEGDYFKQFKDFTIKGITVTNAKFTSQFIKYSGCVGLDLLGWRYPTKEGLQHIIETQKLYPITILPSFRRFLIEPFAARQRMLVGDVLDIGIDELARETGIHREKLLPLIKEAKALLNVERQH